MKSISAIHQFHPSCSVGDGVTNSLFFTRRLLRQMGFQSEIYCDQIPAELRREVQPLANFDRNAEDVLLLQHHSLGYRGADWLQRIKAARVLVYHNITPPHLLPSGELAELSVLGRQQLAEWADQCVGAIGDSDFNSEELKAAGYREIITIPLLVDFAALHDKAFDLPTTERLRDTLNILFVGRMAENKRQHELVAVFDELRHHLTQPARLILAGGTTSAEYLSKVQQEIGLRGLQNDVLLTGKVSDEVLQALYGVADLFVCLSEHEGFCMPVLEAMVHDVPVVARDAGALASTMGSGGLVLKAEETDARRIAAVWHTVLTEPGLRRRMLAGQRRNLERFDHSRLLAELASYLQRLGVTVPQVPTQQTASTQPYWQVEGPIDSFFSLAIVNRELALALSSRGLDTGLFRSTRDGGSNEPYWLETHAPAAAVLAENALTRQKQGVMPEVSLRFAYPPWVDRMKGLVRAVHSYGWEESNFPLPYVMAFNRGLDLVTTLSTEVSKILRDSGVRIPMAVVGTGVDHIFRETPVPVEMPADVEQTSFRFLHVSSCFPRKGVDALIAAYGKAFKASDDVVLIIKTFPNPHNDVVEQLAEARRQNPDYPRVFLINRDLPQAQILWLYRYCHALVAPSRGEGFGMPMAEAMLLDMPVIATAWGGQSDFCTDETAWLCDYDFAFSTSHVGASHSVWAEPKVEHLAELMREVRNAAPEERRRRTEAARRLCEREFTWQRVAERTEQAVTALKQQPMLRQAPRVGWLTTWNTRCGIATYSQFLSESFPDDRMLVLASRSKERVVDDQDYVIRCWDESIDTDNLDEVIENVRRHKLGALVIQYNFGFFSIRALAHLIRTLKAEGVAVFLCLHATADVNKESWKISLREIATELAMADRLLVHGVADLNRLKAFGLVKNVTLFPHGVLKTPETAVLSPSSPVYEMHKRLVGKRVIATYGFLLPHKGVQDLIRAFARLAKQDASLHLLLSTALYPSGVSVQEKRECEALIEELQLADKVSFNTEFLPDQDTLALLSMAEIVVYPYQFTQESASGAVRLGLASGKPVAVTPLAIFDDVAEAVHYLPGQTEADLHQGLGELLANAAVREDLKRKTREWCETRHWDKLSIRLLDMIDGVSNDLPPFIANSAA